MNAQNVTVIEDEKQIADVITYALNKNSYSATVFYTAEDFFLSKKFDDTSAYVIDLGLPGIDGLKVIKFIRTIDKTAPIFIVSGSLNEDSVNEGLNAGADDYVMKPFNPNVLLKKIQNAAEKVALLKENSITEGLKLFDTSHTLMNEGILVELTSREYLIVKKLLESKSPVKREDLISVFPGTDINVRAIDVHICSARKKLKKANLKIRTMRGKGYSLAA